VFGKFLAMGTWEVAEGDPKHIERHQKLNRCRLLEHGALAERWTFLLSMICPSVPQGISSQQWMEGITELEWEEMRDDIRRRITNKFCILYIIDLGQRLHEKNREVHAHLDGDGGLRGPLRAKQIAIESEKESQKKKRGRKRGSRSDNDQIQYCLHVYVKINSITCIMY